MNAGTAPRPNVATSGPTSAVSSWLDRFADRSTLHFGADRVAYQAFAVAGFAIAVPVLFASTMVHGVQLVAVVLLLTATLVGFAIMGVIQRMILGRERYVLWENVALILGLVVGVAALSKTEVAVLLNCTVLALGVFLAVARWGCLAQGCCHGQPAGWGIRYTGGLHADDPVTGVRLFPVQLADSAALVVATALAAAVMITDPQSGAPTAVWLLGYGCARFCLEFIRGDRQPRLGPLTEAQWTFVLVVIVVVVWQSTRKPELAIGNFVLLGTAGLVATLAYVSRSRWLALRPPAPSSAELRTWQSLLALTESATRNSRHTHEVEALWAEDPLQVAMTIDQLDGPFELHSYAIRRPAGLHDLDDAARAVALVVQRLGPHEVLRVDVCQHQAAVVWTRVNRAGPAGSLPSDNVDQVVLRLRACQLAVAPWLLSVALDRVATADEATRIHHTNPVPTRTGNAVPATGSAALSHRRDGSQATGPVGSAAHRLLRSSA